MSQQVGDAVLRFLGDSTQLDAAFDSVGPKAQAAFDPAAKSAEGLGEALDDTGKKAESAADDIEDAGTRTRSSMREARGEAALLGEEFGIHLPRHVRNFVAELPGVGEALSAAFSATAILFLAQALIDVTRKVSDFVGSTLIFTSAMREQYAELVKQNIAIAQQGELYKKAEEELKNLNDQRTPLAKLTDQLAALNKEYDSLATDKFTPSAVLDAKARSLAEQIKLVEKQIELQKQADEKSDNKKALEGLKQQIALQKDLTLAIIAYHQAEFQGQDKSNFEEARFQTKLLALEKEKAAEEKYNKDNLAGIKALNNQIKVLMVERGTQVAEELNKERADLDKTLMGMQADVKATGGIDIVMPESVQNILKMQNAAHSLGITLRSDLVSAVNTAIAALNAYKAAGGTSTVVTDAFKHKIAELEKQLNNFGIDQEKFKARTENTWENFQHELKNGAQATQNLSQLGKEAFNSLSAGMQSAIQTVILAQGSLGQALEKATASALASLASQAIVKALFYTAEGFAALAGFEDTSATQYFTAAGEMAAVGAAAGLAAHAMSGAGGGNNNNTQQAQNSVSNTNQSNRAVGATVGVQHFATGGLISAPTLAVMGEESRQEAVLPLEDPRAMAKIGQSINEAGGGGGVHFHLPHGSVISADVLSHLASKMSKAVQKGQITLLASNSLRLTKRSA